MDRLVFSPLKVRCILGVTPKERMKKQVVEVRVAVEFNASHAGKSDRLEDTVNYPDIVREVVRFVNKSEYKLLEALTENLARKVLSTFLRINAVNLSVMKKGFDMDNLDSVCFEVRRTRSKNNKRIDP